MQTQLTKIQLMMATKTMSKRQKSQMSQNSLTNHPIKSPSQLPFVLQFQKVTSFCQSTTGPLLASLLKSESHCVNLTLTCRLGTQIDRLIDRKKTSFQSLKCKIVTFYAFHWDDFFAPSLQCRLHLCIKANQSARYNVRVAPSWARQVHHLLWSCLGTDTSTGWGSRFTVQNTSSRVFGPVRVSDAVRIENSDRNQKIGLMRFDQRSWPKCRDQCQLYFPVISLKLFFEN